MANGNKEQSSTGVGFWGRVGRRTLIHFCGFALFGVASDIYTDNPALKDLCIGIYLGVICLFPRGAWNDPKWYLPTATGLVQAALLPLLGLPWFAGIFWGGVQTWLQRLLQSHGRMGLEWWVCLFLIMAASDYFDKPGALPFSLWPLLSVIPVFVAGVATRMLYMRIRREAVHKAMLSRALRRIHAASGNQQLGEEVQKQITILLSQSAALEQAKLHCEPEGRELIGQIDAVSETLQNTVNVPHNGWPGILYRVQGGGRQDAPDLADTLRQCNTKIMAMLRGGATKANQNTAGLDSLEIFEQQARQLMFKAQTAPKQIAPQLEAIALLTFDMVKSMRDDPRDRPSGERFLQRYLPAADHCAEEYAKLVSANNTREDVLQAIAQGEEFFERLHKAFEVELASMLANDSASFSAELNALEKLLRMSGH